MIRNSILLVAATFLSTASATEQANVAAQVATNSGAVAPTVAAPARVVPFGLGERMDYQVKFGIASVGKGAMEVMGIEVVRGKPAWKVEMRVDGGLWPVYSLKATYSSWFDTTTLNSLRYTAVQNEEGNPRNRYFEIFPERSVFRQRITPDTLPEMPSVSDPLDDASFMYFIRTAPLEVGKEYSYPRYFRPDRNPVLIKVLKKESISVPLGQFDALVIQPTIKTSKFFAEGKGRIWISDDPLRLILRIEADVPQVPGSLHLFLTSYTPPRRR